MEREIEAKLSPLHNYNLTGVPLLFSSNFHETLKANCFALDVGPGVIHSLEMEIIGKCANQWLFVFELVTYGKFIIGQLTTEKVSFSFNVPSYHGDIKELSLLTEVILIPNVSLCVPRAMFLDLLVLDENLEFNGIIFKVVYARNVASKN